MSKDKGVSVQTTIVGYQYFVGMHMICCHSRPNAVKRVRVGEEDVWYGDVRENITIYVNRPEAFRKSQEGGIKCYVDVEFGEDDQEQNEYLLYNLNPDHVSAHRGVLGFVLNQVFVGESPYIKPWSFLIERTKTFDDWYSEKATIPYLASKTLEEELAEEEELGEYTGPYGVIRTPKNHHKPWIAVWEDTLYHAWIGDGQIWVSQMDVDDDNTWEMKQLSEGNSKSSLGFKICQAGTMYFMWHQRIDDGLMPSRRKSAVYTAFWYVNNELGIDGIELNARQRTNHPAHDEGDYIRTGGWNFHSTYGISKLEVDFGIPIYYGLGMGQGYWPNQSQVIVLNARCGFDTHGYLQPGIHTDSWCLDNPHSNFGLFRLIYGGPYAFGYRLYSWPWWGLWHCQTPYEGMVGGTDGLGPLWNLGEPAYYRTKCWGSVRTGTPHYKKSMSVSMCAGIAYTAWVEMPYPIDKFEWHIIKTAQMDYADLIDPFRHTTTFDFPENIRRMDTAVHCPVADGIPCFKIPGKKVDYSGGFHLPGG
jgi:hypothetical protein